MRVAVIGGTRFIGRAAVEMLVARGHQVVVLHRGQTEPADLAPVTHVHVDRAQLATARAQVDAFAPDAILDCMALTRVDAETAVEALPRAARWVALSSIDVYRAYGALLAGRSTDSVPLTEESPVRAERYPYRSQRAGMDDYEKLDVEEVVLARGGTVLRLPMVHGPHDRQRREEFVLRRVRAGRTRIPIGSGDWLTCRAYVGSIALGVCLALEHDRVAGEVFNLAEAPTASMHLWVRQILDVAGAEAELVRVPDDVLPDDLGLTGRQSQHLLADASKAQRVLGWTHADPLVGLRASVSWHLAHPPADSDGGFEADDRALTTRAD